MPLQISESWILVLRPRVVGPTEFGHPLSASFLFQTCHKRTVPINAGVPQGFVLAFTLLFINDLTNASNPVYSFANDVASVVSFFITLSAMQTLTLIAMMMSSGFC